MLGDYATLCVSVLVVGIIYYFFGPPRRKNYPPGPIPIPFFGNLLSMGEEPHLAFARYAKKYGPIFSVRMGQEEAVIIHDPKLIREAFNDANFLGRPINEAVELFLAGGRHGIGLNVGESWVEQRRFSVRHLAEFGFGKTSMEGVIMDDVNELMDWMANQGGKPLSIQRRLALAVFNSFWGILTGERINHGDPKLTSMLDEVEVRLTAMFGRKMKGLFIYFYPAVAKMFPNWSGWTVLLKSLEGRGQTFDKTIAEHEQTLPDNEPRDFIDAFLMEVRQTTDPKSSFHPSIAGKSLRGVMGDFFTAGADSTSNQLYWAILYLVNRQDIQQILRDEVDRVVGQSRKPALSDRNSMPCHEAFLMELMRITSIGSVGFPHCAVQDTEFKGFMIPKGTSVYASLHALHHDENIWGDPEAFRPDRFLSSDRTRVVRHEALLPFSTGKRVCIGENLAKNQMFLFTSCLVQRFQILPEPGKPYPTLTVKTGSVTLEPHHYHVVMKDRT